MHKMKASFAIATIALAGIAGTAAAGNKTATLSVTATVAGSCEISTTPVAFGIYDPTSTIPTRETGAVTLTCVKDLTSAVSLDLGVQPNGTVRNMKGTGAEVLSYQLYQPIVGSTSCNGSETTVWGDGDNGSKFQVPAAPDATARTYIICGQIGSGQNVSPDTYSDTVTAKVEF